MVPPEVIAKHVNPKNEAPYAGPTGIVRGVVRMTGDAPPPMDKLSAMIPVGKCLAAHEMYRHLFRVDAQGGLADALVTVSRYAGHVPATRPPEPVVAKDCAYDRRTVVATFGQELSVINRGQDSYTPRLDGVPTRALLLAIPGGAPIRLIPPSPGVFRLVDQSHPHIFADVYVLAYPTTDVTDVAGHFEISGVPVGKAQVNALLPVLQATASADITVLADKATEVELQLHFDRADYERRVRPSEE